MNTKDQAKSGFKTFVLTFIVSLLVFGTLYYLVSDSSTSEANIEQETVLGYNKSALAVAEPEEMPAGTPSGEDEPDVVQPQVGSPFGGLAEQKMAVEPRVVLAGAAESTQSTVPETGITGITIGLVGSITLFAIFAYVTSFNPRRYAYSKFEEDVIRDRE